MKRFVNMQGSNTAVQINRNGTFTSIGHACFATKKDFEEYMDIMVHGRDPLPIGGDCFNLSGQETPRWIKQVEPDPEMNPIADFLTPEVLDIKREFRVQDVCYGLTAFFCLKEDLDDYLEAFKMPRNGKHRRIAVPKLNKNGRQVFFPAVPEKPPRPIRYQHMPKPIFLLVSDSGSPISLASTLSPC
ncbi:hypothetical protein NC653_032870 [Populus alba x Populus x berolinensis]|uniref:Uncharacterized protein n=1 Tax=Populus alba x Populus x berolinensis TaxID=444605 RepID=A0AAD6LTL6_9ROSI|nr:hypothetical protein NC653_032870 [Populus alba x Populus x berolinensis]